MEGSWRGLEGVLEGSWRGLGGGLGGVLEGSWRGLGGGLGRVLERVHRSIRLYTNFDFSGLEWIMAATGNQLSED